VAWSPQRKQGGMSDLLLLRLLGFRQLEVEDDAATGNFMNLAIAEQSPCRPC
jgi:hypothetical protein